jgi:tetraacyldisaccharide 4'-kinase
LLNPTQFRDLVSGRRRGIGATLLRCFLRLVEVFYTAAVRRRMRQFDQGKRETHRMAIPVISVGNLTLGGTGKTPMVEWLVRWIQAQEVQVGVVSRGYGAARGDRNDEAMELAQKLPNVPHIQNPDRVAAAREAVTKYGCQAIVLDDGFQHRRIGRDFDIVLLDALEPFGFGHVFPRGTLREPLEGLGRADVVVLTRADLLDPEHRETIWTQVKRYAPKATHAEAIHAPWRLLSASGTESPLSSLRGQPVAVFCGIGNPEGFRHTVETCGCRIVGFRPFADHHRYTQADIDSLSAWADSLEASTVLCTCKDLVKLPTDQLGNRPLHAIDIELEFLTGQSALESELSTLLSV